MLKNASGDRGGETAEYREYATLRLSRGARRTLSRALRTAGALEARSVEAGEGVRRLNAEARLIEALCDQAVREGGARLPARHGRPRLLECMEALLSFGEARLTEDALMEALRAQPFTQAELWATPAVLRIAIAEGCARVARDIAAAGRACARAEGWAVHPGPVAEESPAFFEHALMVCGENGLSGARERLEARLRRRGVTPEDIIRQTHERCARRCMRLDNLMAAERMLDGLDVSSVDSGNLAACALACAGLVEDEALAGRLRALAEGMDFAALYDVKRQLFHIGWDAEADAPSPSHYDLLASESRILSFTAMLLGQVPVRHWRRLGRACVRAAGGAALVSWSGTMFEYLMPELLMPAPPLSLLGQSARAAVAAQMAWGRPWGISESGYHAFDAHMNYQYRAFGLRALALSGSATEGVVAPYASALALSVRPREAADNLMHMDRLGWRDDLGFYEAADRLRPGADGGPALVMSHMAHHQGMTLCAIGNALTGNALARGFMADARARAVALLLEERAVCRSRLKALKKPMRAARRELPAVRRCTRPNCPADVHLLVGRAARAFVTPDGAVHFSRFDFDATRFSDDLYNRPDAARVWLRVKAAVIAPDWQGEYQPGFARFEARCGALGLRMTVCLSPEDDVLYREVELSNTGDSVVETEVMDVAPVALARGEDQRAHAAFQRLFVIAARDGADGLRFRRRPRNPGETCPELVHRVAGFDRLRYEADYDRLMGRGDMPRFELTGTLGPVLDPVSALCAGVTLEPGETRRLCFALQWTEAGQPAQSQLQPERAARLSRARMEAALGFLGLNPTGYHRWDRLSALLLDPYLAGRAKAWRGPAPHAPREELWALGISGDLPILALRFSDPAHVECARTLLRAWSFYGAMGLQTELILADACAGGYDRPGVETLNAMVDAWAPEARNRPTGGVRVLTGVSAEQWVLLRRAAAIALESGETLDDQLRTLLGALEERVQPLVLNPGASRLEGEARRLDNGFGGFAADGSYHIDVTPGRPTPAPWCNILAHESMGVLLTERGGGFLWHGNSRSGRLTPDRGDAPWLRLCLCRLQTGEALPLLPGNANVPFRVRYSPDAAGYGFDTDAISCDTVFRLAGNAVLIDIDLELRRLVGHGWQVCADVEWLMGADARDAAWLRTWSAAGGCFASGVMPGVGYLACDRSDAACGDGLVIPVHRDANHLRLVVGWAEHPEAALEAVRAIQEGDLPGLYREAGDALQIDTPDLMLNDMMNTFLPHQVRASRLYGRTGFYQPGGAYGFRDQLQDMLALLPTEPEKVRAHLLLCAGRQFAAGDVLHWWHMPYLGVRTRIADDRLFLPYVTAAYVRRTGDTAVLDTIVPYLEDVPIPEGREDVFAPMRPGAERGTLHDHCMRAFRSSGAVGNHGLALMGAGDWNDGMNRVGHQGRGESVWLSEFIAACADAYADICPEPEDAEALRSLARRHRGAVELYGWDGRWYRRAFMDDGTPLGAADSEACQIDLIAQAWAVLSGLSGDRCRAALDAAWDRLVDADLGVVRLLDPPFPEHGADPGYIRGYPEGIRENGAQYTHAVCWLLLALIRHGDATRAHALLEMLLPPNHSDTPEKARRYAVEPYVLAADVYTLPGREGRGGWTWYTGSAAWLYVAVLELLGFERRGDRVRLCPLLGPWRRVTLTLRCGQSLYTLESRRDIRRITLDEQPVSGAYIDLVDDGREHLARFPGRRGEGDTANA